MVDETRALTAVRHAPDAARAFARFLARADLKAKFSAVGLNYKFD